MKIAVILIVLVVVAAIALIVIGSRRATARKKIESDKMVARAEAMLADHRRIQAERIANLPKPAPQRIASGTPVSYAKGGTVKPAPKPKTKPNTSSSNDETVGYAYEVPDFGYADYTSYDSGSSGSSYNSGSSDSGYSSGGSSSYDSGSSSSSSSSADSGSSW